MKHTLVILFSLFCGTVCGQDLYLNCGDSKIPYYNGGRGHFEPMTFCPYIEYSDTSKIPQAIRQTNRQYLTGRLGETFMQ